MPEPRLIDKVAQSKTDDPARADRNRAKLGVQSPFTGKWTGDRWASPEKRRVLPPIEKA